MVAVLPEVQGRKAFLVPVFFAQLSFPGVLKPYEEGSVEGEEAIRTVLLARQYQARAQDGRRIAPCP